jgi:L-cysteine S-thiosulfotransferase
MKNKPLAGVYIAYAAIKNIAKITTYVSAVAVLASCAAPSGTGMPSAAELLATLKSSFSERGPAKMDRLDQNEVQRICSEADKTGKAVDEGTRKKIETALYAGIPYPSDAKYIGNWQEGEKIAQDGTGLQFSDAIGKPSGANCYACHQIAPKEISFGNLGPSLYKYGVNRGVKDPNAAESEAIVKYTWARLWNTHSVNLCSSMPRFGDAKILTNTQLKDVMALLLDPQSPVNK